MTETEIKSEFYKEHFQEIVDIIAPSCALIYTDSGLTYVVQNNPDDGWVTRVWGTNWGDGRYTALHSKLAVALIEQQMVAWLHERGVFIYRDFTGGWEGSWRVAYSGRGIAPAKILNVKRQGWKRYPETLYAAVMAAKGQRNE